MSQNFSAKFEGRSKKLLNTSKPLKPQIAHAISRVESQIQRINYYINRYAERDKALFEKIVQAYKGDDILRVSILANELAEIRKQRTLLMNAKLSLETVALRLRTVYEFGDFVSAVSPMVDNLQNIKTRISGILPDVGNELGQIGIRLNDLVVKTNQGASDKFDFDVTSRDVEKIIEEAAIATENRTKAKLSDLPSDERGR